MDNSLKNKLEITAYKIRKNALTAVHSAASGHPGGSLSIAEIMSVLYFKQMNVDPKNPKWADSDLLTLQICHDLGL